MVIVFSLNNNNKVVLYLVNSTLLTPGKTLAARLQNSYKIPCFRFEFFMNGLRQPSNLRSELSGISGRLATRAARKSSPLYISIMCAPPNSPLQSATIRIGKQQTTLGEIELIKTE